MPVAAAAQLRDDLQRPVEPGPEAVGEQVVGAAAGEAGRIVARVALAEAQRQRGNRQDEHDR
jgi:hypothetical protein